MGKNVPKKYGVGELQRVRENLGPLSENEAKRMMSILGGEVGTEHDDEEIEKKYQRIREIQRNKNDRVLYPEAYRRESDKKEMSSGQKFTQVPIKESQKNISFGDRIKMDFLSSRPEYRLKTRADAFLSLFSGFFTIPDRVNSYFIKRGDLLFYRFLERLVLSIRGLSPKEKYGVTLNPKLEHFYLNILSIMQHWDIEGIHFELSKLQRRPRQTDFSACTGLCKRVLTPIVRLMDCDVEGHIEQAVHYAHDIQKRYGKLNKASMERLSALYADAVDEVPEVFYTVKRMFYPMLMKQLRVPFCEYADFYSTYRTQILEFFSLSEYDILSVPDIIPEKGPDSGNLDQMEKKQNEEKEKGKEDDKRRKDVFFPGVEKGLDLLDRMFPRAGWKNLQETPDLYAYFNTLFDFPRGVELVSQKDPVHVIIMLLEIIKSIFYGLGSIKYGTIPSQDGEGEEQLQPIMDNFLNEWHRFFDEVIMMQYVSPLNQYCRNLDMNRDFQKSEYGKKLRGEVLWTRRLYLLPFSDVSAVSGIQKSKTEGIPALFDFVTELKQVLSRIVLELDTTLKNQGTPGSCRSVENPWDQADFPIENIVSKRISKLLRNYQRDSSGKVKIKHKRTNANLLLYTFFIVLVLDYLINDEESVLYTDYAGDLYRHIGETSQPQFSVETYDTYALIKQQDKQAEKYPSYNDNADEAPRDIHDILGIEEVKRTIEHAVERFSSAERGFTLVKVQYIVDNNARDRRDEIDDKISDLVSFTIRQYYDVPIRDGENSLYVLFPDTSVDNAKHIVRRLFFSIHQQLGEGSLSLYAAIVEHEHDWSTENLLQNTEHTLQTARSMHVTSIARFNKEAGYPEIIHEV